mmetsp:Transcript_17264/g.56640  ORF Transcript_17264/g.56640 Transcript_17264/m.56640 type:complete len:206 (+) Transcript_17264:1182-1799(+)
MIGGRRKLAPLATATFSRVGSRSDRCGGAAGSETRQWRTARCKGAAASPVSARQLSAKPNEVVSPRLSEAAASNASRTQSSRCLRTGETVRGQIWSTVIPRWKAAVRRPLQNPTSGGLFTAPSCNGASGTHGPGWCAAVAAAMAAAQATAVTDRSLSGFGGRAGAGESHASPMARSNAASPCCLSLSSWPAALAATGSTLGAAHW